MPPIPVVVAYLSELPPRLLTSYDSAGRLGILDHWCLLPAGHSHCSGGVRCATAGVGAHPVSAGRADVQLC